MPPEPTILAFDTSAAHCAAALLLRGEGLIRVEEMARGQGERLLPFLEELLAEAGITWADLDALGVGTGPGNFTGIRISVSAARGLALGLGIPAVGVSLFDTTGRLSGRAQTAVPAPREQSYYFDPDTMPEPKLTTLDKSVGEVARSDAYEAADHVEMIARMTAERADPEAPAPVPLYVKPADAAPPRDAPPVILP